MGVARGVAAAAIRVVPATPDRWPDVVTLLGGNGDVGCWCEAPPGRARMFEKAGFRRVVETAAHRDHRPRILMRLEFEPGPTSSAR